jgi:hypothetical protein
MATTARRLFHITLTAQPDLAHELLLLASGRAFDIKVSAVPIEQPTPTVDHTTEVIDAPAEPIPPGLNAREFLLRVLSEREQVDQKELMKRAIFYGLKPSGLHAACHKALKDKQIKRPRPGVFARGRNFILRDVATTPPPLANGHAHANGHANTDTGEPTIANSILAVLRDGEPHKMRELKASIVKAGFSKYSIGDALRKMLTAEQLRRVGHATYAL